MRRSRFYEEQIVKILESVESGVSIDDACREHGISRRTFFRWRSKFGGMKVDDAKRSKQLEDEKSRLKRAVADPTLDKQVLQIAGFVLHSSGGMFQSSKIKKTG